MTFRKTGRREKPSPRALRFVCLLILVAFSLKAQPADIERRDYETARVALEDGQYGWAEERLSAFVRNHPDSELFADAVLLQARARYQLGRHLDSLTLLDANLAKAGERLPEFQFWIAENQSAMENHKEAAETYGLLASSYSESSLALEAAYRQAFTLQKAGNTAEATRLLSSTNGVFQRLREKRPGAAPSIQGGLLLAQNLYDDQQFSQAEIVLGMIPSERLAPEFALRQSLLYARLYDRQGRLDEAEKMAALAGKFATQARLSAVAAEVRSLHGGILEKQKRWNEAIEMYRQNLDASLPEPWRREALLKTIELILAQQDDSEAIRSLEALSTNSVPVAEPALLQLTLGELKLRQFYRHPEAPENPPGDWPEAVSNVINQAENHFQMVTKSHTNSPLTGKAWLNLGWCLWQKQAWEEAGQAFAKAAEHLPRSLDQALAVLKQGDCAFHREAFNEATGYYGRVIRDYSEDPVVRSQLLDQVYYQMIQASIRRGDPEAAARAMTALLEQFPESYHSERGLLLTGQALMDIRQPEIARQLFEVFSEKFPNSEIMPRVRLALARTYSLEGNWTRASREYQDWLGVYPDHPLRPDAEFSLALNYSRAGDVVQALPIFTNFVSRFPQHPLTPKALQWTGDHYLNTRQYAESERYYQQIFSSNRSDNPLRYEAQIWAARSAMLRQGYNEARSYLTNLINHPSCPTNLMARAIFALGDVSLKEPSDNPTRLDIARTAFDQVIRDHQDSPLIPMAWGRMGDCNFQLNLFQAATNAYITCMFLPQSGVVARSQAQVQLGLVLEKQAETSSPEQKTELLDKAMANYLEVFYQKNLRSGKNEAGDPFWIKEAGMNAARLAESRQQFLQARKLYERLREWMPVQSDYFDRRIQQLTEAESRQTRTGG